MSGRIWKKMSSFHAKSVSLIFLCLAISPFQYGLRAADPTSEGDEFFEKKIRPVLIENCHKCHASEKHKGNLELTSRAGMLKGGDSGPAIVPGRPEQSLLIKAIRYTDEMLRMPPKSKLADGHIADFTTWIQMGAPWPETAVGTFRAGASNGFNLLERKKHWCWQPLKRVSPPDVKHADWARTPIDRFVLAQLEANGLSPAKPADKRTLIRRVTFDLIGLPPAPAEIDAFLSDDSPKAFARVIDRLLDSPHYGERWGRHWLDLVRYAETYGHEYDFEIPEASAYRDYVIRAFNADVPYDQFVLEHVAGDLLPQPRRHLVERFNESIIGTGFWFLGEAAHSPVDVRADEADHIDNQIDVFAKTFLGLTVACARCHDHKFDAISQRDYYALSGYLQSSRLQRAIIDLREPFANAIAQLDDIRAQARRCLALPAPAGTASRKVEGSVVVFEDFAKGTYNDWFVSGEAFGEGPTRTGEVFLSEDALNPVRQIVPPGVAHSGLRAGKLRGALRSKSFTITRKKILYHAAGSESQINLIIDGYQLIREPIYGGLTIKLNHDKPQWHTQDVGMWLGHRAYIELVDDSAGYLAVDRILFADEPVPAEPLEATIAPTYADTKQLAALANRRKELERILPAPRRALAMADGTSWNDHVHVRGNPNQFGDEVPRRFLEALAGGSQSCAKEGSGRLELARRMIDSSDPLLPRVLVNRIWQHHFGAGIARSPDNFGLLGEPPTHPELLDYLAAEFVRGGWSIKKMHRLLLLSATYQMASHAEAASEAHDPQNKLLQRMPIQRLEAECIRDAILAVSGRLEAAMFGKSIPPYLTPHMAGRGRPVSSGPLDGDGRRSIYLNLRRNFLTPLFLAFDYPIPFTTIGRRSVSNVPAQALALMNNVFVVEQAETWAKKVLSDKNKTASRRVTELYETAFGRPPDAMELSEAMEFLQNQGAMPNSERLQAWRDLCHVLFNVKEFIFIN